MAFHQFGWAVRKPHLFLYSKAAVEIFVIEPSIFHKDKWLTSACALQPYGQCLPPPLLLGGDTTRVLRIYCPFKLCQFARTALSKIQRDFFRRDADQFLHHDALYVQLTRHLLQDAP